MATRIKGSDIVIRINGKRISLPETVDYVAPPLERLMTTCVSDAKRSRQAAFKTHVRVTKLDRLVAAFEAHMKDET